MKKFKKLLYKRLSIEAIGIILLFLIVFMLDGNLCVYKRIVGIPCPGCGMTRAFISLSRFDFWEAFHYHPLFILPILVVFLHVFANTRFASEVYRSNRFWLVILFIVFSVYAYRMLTLFPDQAPMDFNRRAVVPLLIEWIRAF